MRVLRRLFWVFLVLAAFVYGFIYGSEQVTIADVQTFVTDAWRSAADPVTIQMHLQEIMEQPLAENVKTWIQEIFEKAYSLICFFQDGVV